jgi:hypothetical protein
MAMRASMAVVVFAAGVVTGATLHALPAVDSARAAARTAASEHESTAESSIESRLTRAEDHIEIERLLMDYGRTLDKRDFAAFSRLFAANGEWTGNLGTFKGPAMIQAAMERIFNPPGGAPVPPFHHLLTNVIIDIDGDHATAMSQWTFVQLVGGKPQVGAVGHYDDRLVRENGHWRFLRRAASVP